MGVQSVSGIGATIDNVQLFPRKKTNYPKYI